MFGQRLKAWPMKTLTTLLAAALLAVPASAQPIDSKTQARIDRILKRTPLIDGHNDLPWELRDTHDSRVEGLESGGAALPPEQAGRDGHRGRRSPPRGRSP